MSFIFKFIRYFNLRILQMIGIRSMKYMNYYMFGWNLALVMFCYSLFMFIHFFSFRAFLLTVMSITFWIVLAHIGKKYGSSDPELKEEKVLPSPNDIDPGILMEMYKRGIDIYDEEAVKKYLTRNKK